jgi:hypothetical protein
MKPAKRILDPAFQYRPSYATDIRKTFKRAMRASPRQPAGGQISQSVVPLKKRA